MNTIFDIVVCAHGTASTRRDNGIKNIILKIFDELLRNNTDVRIGVIGFQSIMRNTFISNRALLKLALNNNEVGGEYVNGNQNLGDAFYKVLAFNWHDNNNHSTYYEKVVIVFTDSAPRGLFTELRGQDPWVMSNHFRERNITLLVVGIGKNVYRCDSFYCALAENTGGRYIPFVNAEKILTNIINSCVVDEDTVHQVLAHIPSKNIEENSAFRYSSVSDDVDAMINGCQTINDIRKQFYEQPDFPYQSLV